MNSFDFNQAANNAQLQMVLAVIAFTLVYWVFDRRGDKKTNK